MKQFLIFTFLLVLSLSNVKGAGVNSSQQKERETIDMPDIPSDLKDPSKRADYLITHFWDKLDFNDRSKTSDAPLMEQSLVNFLSILPYASSENVVKNGFSILFDRAEKDKDTFSMLTRTTTAYLSGHDSPMHSDLLYLIYLDVIKDSPSLTDSERIRIEDRIEMFGKNRQGTKAADFSFKTPDGKTSSLYETLIPGKDTLLIFFDPECENCEVVMEKIQQNKALNKDLKDGKLRILAIYSGDNEVSWLRKAARLPSSWTVGINDGEIEEEELYFLPVMPTLYLLDGNGIVMEKDLEIQ